MRRRKTKTCAAASGSTGSAGPRGWGTLEVGDLDEVLRCGRAVGRGTARLADAVGLGQSSEEGANRASSKISWTGEKHLAVPFVLVSDEVGLGVVPESEAGRRFRDVLGLVNQRAAAAAEEVHLCVAGVGVRIK